MDKLPKLFTNRLVLDQLNSSDIPKIIEYAGNSKIAEMTLNIPHPYEEKDAIFWLNRAHQGLKDKTEYSFAVRLKSSEAFIGGIGLMVNNRFNLAEFGYWIAEPFWNNGYATEATRALLEFGFEELQLNKIHASHLIGNPASGRVMIKNRMIKEGELKDHVRKDDVYNSLIQYRLTRSEFSELQNIKQ